MKVSILSIMLIACSFSSNLSAKEPTPQGQLSDSEIRQMIIQQSISEYSGSCPCPYNLDRAGRRCGKRSAYTKPGGASPICYASQISDQDVETYRRKVE